ncbi:hypothetical protein J2S14_001207 [Lederbergia wuyishanensis]|uniref:Uncharacterized protein n=1 Tax=Lederbergia wuyishanensis TaxID=1347903 RepID=A0ABU0D202_9BACI|nr:hypothetical protein [Lederbergia wuyishanensis]
MQKYMLKQIYNKIFNRRRLLTKKREKPFSLFTVDCNVIYEMTYDFDWLEITYM